MIATQVTDDTIEKEEYENATVPPFPNWPPNDEAEVTISTSGWWSDFTINPNLIMLVGASIDSLWDLMTNSEKVMITLNEFEADKTLLRSKGDVLSRIAELNNFLAEDVCEPDLSADSVGACLQFLNKNNDLSHPDIMASPNGNIIFQWRKDKSRNLTIEFLADNYLNYVVFAPAPSATIRVSGRCNQKEFGRCIESFHTERWTVIDAG